MKSEEAAQLRLASGSVGSIGLQAALEETAETHAQSPDDVVEAELLRRLGRDNYIPQSARTGYGRAFVGEFRNFLGRPYEEDEPGAASRPACWARAAPSVIGWSRNSWRRWQEPVSGLIFCMSIE